MENRPYALRPSRVVNIEDLRRVAKRRLPRSVFDYIDGGAEDEITMSENRVAFREVTFRSRKAVAISDCDTTTRVLGHNLSFPVLLAPVGSSRLMHPGGEIAAAAAAGEAGIGYILSTISGYKLERVKAASRGPVFYQLYLLGGRAAAESALDRAREAGFSALVVTVDTPVSGMRERDPRNGMKEMLSASVLSKLPYLPNILAHPRWLFRFLLDGGVRDLENVVIPGKGPMKMAEMVAALSQTVVTWDDLGWIRKVWTGPIVVKGIMTGDDARRAVDQGAAAVVVSNHGGRQLEGESASLRALPEIVSSVGGQTEILMDSGVRRGSDIVKAICLGARAVLIGRAYVYGLAAQGQAGVSVAIDILRTDVERTLRLLGCASVAELNASYCCGPACMFMGPKGAQAGG